MYRGESSYVKNRLIQSRVLLSIGGLSAGLGLTYFGLTREPMSSLRTAYEQSNNAQAVTTARNNLEQAYEREGAANVSSLVMVSVGVVAATIGWLRRPEQ